MKEQRSWGKTLSLTTTALSLVTGTTFLTASFPGSLFPPLSSLVLRQCTFLVASFPGSLPPHPDDRGVEREWEQGYQCSIGKMHAEMLHSSTYHNVAESVGQDPVAVGEIVELVLN